MRRKKDLIILESTVLDSESVSAKRLELLGEEGCTLQGPFLELNECLVPHL